MMNKNLYLTMLILSTLMVMNSNNWINMWMGLEMNLMSFMPIMFYKKNNFLSQASMIYFLTQSMASAMFLAFILYMKLLFLNMNQPIMNSMIMMSMAIKMGMPPFHSWMPKVMNSINWKSCLILMTWQKLAPMFILSLNMNQSMANFMIIWSSFIGAIMGLNQTSMRKIMAYSSMTHMGWMVASMKSNNKTWLIYLLIYSMTMIMLCIFCSNINILNINQMSLFNTKLSEKVILIMLMMSMGGLPPFIGFLPKWMVLINLMNSKEWFLMLIMLMFNIITLFYYLRMTTSMNLMLSATQKWNMKKSKNTTKYMYMLSMIMIPMVLVNNFI